MKEYAYDIETYRNFFSGVFINIQDQSDIHEFSLYEGHNDLNAFCEFVRQPSLRLIGYNSGGFDDVVVKYILSKPNITNRDIYKLAKKIILSHGVNEYDDNLKTLHYGDTPYESVDLMQLVSVNTIRPSLKSCAIHLKHGVIQDLPLDPDKPVKLADIPMMLLYNRNDTLVTRTLYITLREEITLREGLMVQYGGAMLSASDSKIAKEYLNANYGIPTIQGTERGVLFVNQLLPSNLVFETPELQGLLSRIRNKPLKVRQPRERNYQTEEEDIVDMGLLDLLEE